MEAFNDTTDPGNEMEVPLFISYLKMVMLLLALLVVGIPSALVIRVIAVEKKLHTKYYFFLVNLLFTDFFGLVTTNLVQFISLMLYVSGSNFTLSCILLRIFDASSLTSQLLFITLGIDRFVAIASPYHHKKIMTNKVIVSAIAAVWGLGILITSALIFQLPYVQVYPFARCYVINGFQPIYLFKAVVLAFSTVLIVAINIYLYYQILKSQKKHEENMRLHGESSPTTRRHAALRKNLQKHVKPTVSVLLLGGIDGLCNLLVPILYISFRLILGNAVARLYIAEFVIIPLQWFQLMCHPLVYGLYMTEIRQRIFDFELYYRIFSRRSKVIVLNKQWRNHI